MTLERVQFWVKRAGPWAVGAGSTLDNTGVPIFFVIGMSVESFVGLPTMVATLIAAIIGSIVGDLAVYAIGRYVLTKDRILAGSLGHRFKPLLDAGERPVRRWGMWTVLFGRFVPYVGKVTPLIAGSYGISWFRATFAVVVGSILLMGLYYIYAQTAIAIVRGHGGVVKIVSLAILTAVILLLWWGNRALQKRAQKAHEGDEKADVPD